MTAGDKVEYLGETWTLDRKRFRYWLISRPSKGKSRSAIWVHESELVRDPFAQDRLGTKPFSDGHESTRVLTTDEARIGTTTEWEWRNER